MQTPKRKQLGNPANLRPWKKGVSGNPSGSKGPGLFDLLTKKLDYVCDNQGRKCRNPEGLTWRERLVNSLLRHAEDGDSQALKEVWDRLEGRTKLDINVTSEQDLWTRLNQGRMRLSATIEGGSLTITADLPAPAIELSEGRTFDVPAEDAEVIEAVELSNNDQDWDPYSATISSGPKESVSCEPAIPPSEHTNHKL